MFHHWHMLYNESLHEILDLSFFLMGFRDPTIGKVLPITIDSILIDRTHRDLSNAVSFVYNTCSGVTYRGTYSTVTYI
jgi:hypothetical protein